MASAWLREEEPDLAAEKILEAAGQAFVELGVSGAGMSDIAEYAGCSRGTLYRYFKNRDALHLAFVNRRAGDVVRRIQRGLDAIANPRERLVEGILRALREVRKDPSTAAWFAPGEAGIAARMSVRSEAVDALAGAFVSGLLGPVDAGRDGRLRARWLVRVIVSLLCLPGSSAAEERALIERFVAPSLLPGRTTPR